MHTMMYIPFLLSILYLCSEAAGRTYEILIQPAVVSWDTASTICSNAGGSLATIVDTDDISALADAYDAAGISRTQNNIDQQVFVGLNDKAVETQWKFVDGTPCTRTDGRCVDWWYPNNVDSADCAVAYWMGSTLSGGNRGCSAQYTKNVACNKEGGVGISGFVTDKLQGTIGSGETISFNFYNDEDRQITFTNCQSNFDTKMRIYNGASDITSTSDNNCDGDDCYSAVIPCGTTSLRETIPYANLAAGVYRIEITPYNAGGNYVVEAVIPGSSARALGFRQIPGEYYPNNNGMFIMEISQPMVKIIAGLLLVILFVNIVIFYKSCYKKRGYKVVKYADTDTEC